MIATANLLAGSVLDDQIALETKAVEDGVARYHKLARESIKRGQGASLKPAERLVVYWFEGLRREIVNDKRKAKTGGTEVGIKNWAAIMRTLDAKKAAYLTLHIVLSECMSQPDGVRLGALGYEVGRSVIADQNWDKLKKSHRDIAKEAERRIKNLNPKWVNMWKNRTMGRIDHERTVTSHLGYRLVWDLLSSAVIERDGVAKAAFITEKDWKDGKPVHMIRLSETTLDIIEEGHLARESMRPRYLPMVVKPYPWQDGAQGGYVRIRTPFISKPTSEQKKALAKADLTNIYKGLNALASPEWRTNERIEQIQMQVFDAGGGIAGIPARGEPPKPPRPADMDTNEAARKAWKKEAVEWYKEKIRLSADRLGFHQMMTVSSTIGKRGMYFPHQLDFRSRAYPIPQFLNHQGNDLQRSMLEFARPVPLGSKGRWWLRVHAANCYGVDKVPFDERVKWVEDHVDDIERSVGDPMSTVEWWGAAEKPWQFLAACIALTDDEAACHLPRQVDGTANGLQHYAALTRDRHLAGMVNLLPADRPANFYGRIGDLVAPVVKADPSPEARLIVALVEAGKTTWRKLVKQPSMTRAAYGATNYGASEQQRNVLSDAGLTGEPLYKCSYFLSKITLAALANECHKVEETMAWFKRNAKIVVEEGYHLTWTTPIGFPAVQPYANWTLMKVSTAFGEVYLRDEGKQPEVWVGKQVSAFAPNFIHSLDASHMFAKAIACDEAGIEYAAVHDNDWTHFGNAAESDYINRRTFADQYKESLLHELLSQWRARYPDFDFEEPPELGDFNPEESIHAPYFFS